MNQRAGLLYISKSSERILLILENQKWTVPTFPKSGALIEDAKNTLDEYAHGKIIPIELYISRDNGFEYSTYVCIVDQEFLASKSKTYCWAGVDNLPKNIHVGLKNTLTNSITKAKIETILELQHDAT